MSQTKYIDGEVLDQAFDIYCQHGRSSEQATKLADRLGIEPNDLLQRWGLPSAKPVLQQSGEFDLWAADKLQEVL